MRIRIKKTVDVDATELIIHCRVRDEFCGAICDADGGVLHEFEDAYVPDFMPGDHCGDYLCLKIDIDTGQILNWVRPLEEQLIECISEC